jgi:hypothetical protein
VNSLITAIMDGAQGGTEPPKPTERYLRLISDEVITIGPTDGRGVILPTGLTVWLDPDFYGSGGKINNPPTLETPVQVFEIFRRCCVDTSKVFGGLGRDMNSLCLTPDHVVRCALDNIRLFLANSRYHETFFLYKVGEEIRVACVSREPGMLEIRWVKSSQSVDLSYGNWAILPKL